MPTTTLRQVFVGTAMELDDLGVYALTASSTTVATSAAAIDTTANASTGRYDGAWIYSPVPAQQRRVKKDGFNPATGAWTLNTTWTAPTVGTSVDITRLFPRALQVPGEDTSYRDLIARASGKLLVPDRVTVPITTGESYSLAKPWLDRPERLLRILEPSATGGIPVPSDWRGWRFVRQAGSAYLELGAPFLTATGAITLEVLRPADTLINSIEVTGGTGMQIDTDSCAAPLEDLILGTLMEAYQALMNRSPGRPGNWEARYQDARERFERIYTFDGAFYIPKAATPPAAVAA